MAVKYTPEMLTELRAIEKLDFNSATEFAEKHSISARSVIAKARALDIPYHAQDPRTKSAKTKGETKDDIVARLYERFQVPIPSLAKMTVVDLKLLEEAVG